MFIQQYLNKKFKIPNEITKFNLLYSILFFDKIELSKQYLILEMVEEVPAS